MTLKHKIAFIIFTLTVICSRSQINYLAFDHSSFVLKQKSEKNFSPGLQTNMLRFNGTYIGESFQIGFGRYNSFGIGIGLTKINYEKQWLGIFPETNEFGMAILKGMINYLSIPVSLTLITGAGLRRSSFRRQNPFRSGITITYIPSFQTKNDFAFSTYAAASSSSLLSGYDQTARQFQQTLTIGLCNQFVFFDSHLRLSIEPYIGLGSHYFNVKGNSVAFTYGVKIQFNLHFKLPSISIEKQVNPGNAEEKKRLLQQKQKEIEEQINKQP